MKKLIVCIVSALLLAMFTPIQSMAEKNPISTSAIEKESPELKELIKRVNEINGMDRSTMSRSEKKEIRKELRAIKREVVKHKHRHSGGTVYISGGLLIVILILIIIF